MQNAQASQSKTAPQSPAFQRRDWQRGYESLRQESAYWIDSVEGTIPETLQGTLFRNGPALFDRGGQSVQHPFDGDGMICAIAFSGGRAYFQNRFVRTQGFVEEQQAERFLYRGVFGTQKPGGILANAFDTRLKNIANTQVIYWGGKLLALWEAAEPHRLDPRTLETEGLDRLEGLLQPGDGFAAHPRFDPCADITGGAPCLVNFSIKPGLSTKIQVFEFAPDGSLVRQQSRSVPGFAFIHDFAITPNYCIFFQNPVSFNPLPFLVGLQGAGEAVKFQPDKPTRMLVIPRRPEEPMQVLEARSGFVFHHANAFETEEGLVVDSVCYDSLPTVEPGVDFREVNFAALDPGQLWRFKLDLRAGAVTSERLEARSCEFPTIHPDHVGRPYRYVYVGAAHEPTGNGPLQGILKLDLAGGDRQFWSAAPKGFISEPLFVPKPDAQAEDDGWLLSMVYDSAHHRSEVVILDAQRVSAGPIARLHLKHHVPYGLHGTFVPEYFGPSPLFAGA